MSDWRDRFEHRMMRTLGMPLRKLVRGEGAWVEDDEGTRYLDFLAGIAVNSLGHAHPVFVEAVSRQAATLAHVSNYFATDPALDLADRLTRLTGAGDAGRVWFGNSGAEANEAAFKLARKFGGRGRHVVVSALGSFHGRTLAALAATGQPTKHEPFQPMPEGFRHVAFGDLDALDRAVDSSVAAVLIESVQGEGGVVPAPPGYLAGIRELCDERGVFLVEDAACAAGSTYQGRPVGATAEIATWSFHPRKLLTTGEGGMITTNRPEWAVRARHLRA